MGFHQYSPLFTSGLLSDASLSHTPSPLNFSSVPPQREELRSFLFLDLADIPLAPKRKVIDRARSTWGGRRVAPALPDSDNRPETSSSFAVDSRRASREDLRNLPSPKPAPSSDLPDVPLLSLKPPRLSISLHRPSYSDPSPHILSPTLPDSPIFSKSPSTRSVSIVSSMKRRNRFAALERLEGRANFENRIPSKRQNFMNMSDDDDDDDFYPVLSAEERDGASFRSFDADSRLAMSISSSGSSFICRRRSRTIDSRFPPLANFIDFKEDDWRSFIELSRAN